MRKIVITGGAGFIGSNLVEHLNKNSPETRIVIVDDLSSGRHDNLSGLTYDLREHTILDQRLLSEAVMGADSIIHLGAIGSVPRSVANPRPSHEANATGTLNVLEAARDRGVNHLIVASSSSVYGGNPSSPKTETDWTLPLSPYAVSKLAAESYALAYQASYGLATLALRFFNVYGPRQRADHDYAAVIPRFISAAQENRPLTIFGDGTQSRDFTFVESVCSALFDACRKKVSSAHPVNLAFGTNTTLLELADIIGRHFTTQIEVKHEQPRVGDVRASQADPTAMNKLFPDLQATPLDTGIARTVEWFLT